MNPIARTVFLLAATVLLAGAAGCGRDKEFSLLMHREEKRTITLKLPQLNGKLCGDLIRDRFLGMNEVSSGRSLMFYHSVDYDLSQRTVTVVYQSTVTAGQNVIQVVADLGFDVADANDPKRALPGNPEARKKLPQECR